MALQQTDRSFLAADYSPVSVTKPFRCLQSWRIQAFQSARQQGRSVSQHRPFCCRHKLRAEKQSSYLDSATQVIESELLAPVETAMKEVEWRKESASEASKRRRADKARHQLTYKVAAISASLGVTALAVVAVHYRFAWHRADGSVPWQEAVMTILLVFGGVIGMEMWARWAHKALWHDLAAGWSLHESHHKARTGPFEANDVFAVVNAVPAIALCAYGFFTPTMLGGLAFGSGLGITLFGMMYMFVHDGLVHKRFPVGPLADVPYLKKVAAAHTLHHAERFNGVPWGLFLGPQELEAVGGQKELEHALQRMENQRKP